MKLEKKQVPLFVGLCAVTLVMLGYAAFSLLGGGAAKPAAAGTTPVTAAKPRLDTSTPAKPALPVLNPSFRPDPFRPSMTAELTRPPAPAAASAPRNAVPFKVAVHETLPAFPPPTLEPAPWTPPAPPAVVKQSPAVTAAPAAPAKPSALAGVPAQAKPNFTLTGILEGENRVAILRLSDTRRQVVQEKDQIAGQYVVDEITPNAVVLVSGTDRWRLFLDE